MTTRSRPWLTLRLLAAALTTLAIAAGQAAAATVSNGNDSGPGSLREAVATAAPGETIEVPAGSYTLTSGQLAVLKGVSIAGAGAATTTIRTDANQRLLRIKAPGESVMLSGITLSGGHLLEDPAFGAAIECVDTSLTLAGMRILGNVADARTEFGGGVAQGSAIFDYMLNPEQTLTIIDSTVVGNRTIASGAPGFAGGTASAAVTANGGSVQIARTTIAANTTDVGGGQGPASAEQIGGGVLGAGLTVNGTERPSSISASTVSENVAEARGGPGGEGGVIEGGGVLVGGNSAAVQLSQLTVAGNLADTGSSGAAAGAGVALLSAGLGSTASLTNSTIAGNRLVTGPGEDFGASLYSETGVSVGSSILAAADGQTNCFTDTTLPRSLGYNLESGTSCGFHGPGDRGGTDPQLGALGDNGGPTETMLPALASPAVDGGSGFGLGFDQRGVVRPIDFPSLPDAPGGDGADIGAVEVRPANAIVLGKLVKNRKTGTAMLTVFMPTPNVGAVTLWGKGLVKQTSMVGGTGPTLAMKVAPKSKAVKKALRLRGKRAVAIHVTYAPPGNVALTESRTTKLLKQPKKHHRTHRQP